MEPRRVDDEKLRTTLLDIEHRGWDSLCHSTGGSFYGDLMTADAVMVLANGAVMDRASVVESLEQAPPWRTYEIGDVRPLSASCRACTDETTTYGASRSTSRLRFPRRTDSSDPETGGSVSPCCRLH